MVNKTIRANIGTPDQSMQASSTWVQAITDGLPVPPVYFAVSEQMRDFLTDRAPDDALASVFTLFVVAAEAAANMKGLNLTEEVAVAMVRSVFQLCAGIGGLSGEKIIERYIVRRAAALRERLRQNPKAGLELPDISKARTICQFDDIMLALARRREWTLMETLLPKMGCVNEKTSMHHDSGQRDKPLRVTPPERLDWLRKVGIMSAASIEEYCKRVNECLKLFEELGHSYSEDERRLWYARGVALLTRIDPVPVFDPDRILTLQFRRDPMGRDEDGQISVDENGLAHLRYRTASGEVINMRPPRPEHVSKRVVVHLSIEGSSEEGTIMFFHGDELPITPVVHAEQADGSWRVECGDKDLGPLQYVDHVGGDDWRRVLRGDGDDDDENWLRVLRDEGDDHWSRRLPRRLRKRPSAPRGPRRR